MKGVIFKQDRKDHDLLDRAMNADLDITIPGIFPSPKPLRVRRGEKLSRADIMRKVAKDLRVTLDEDDGFFIFRFPSVWSVERVNGKIEQIKDGIALVEAKCNNSTMMTPKRDAMILYAMHFAVNALVSTLSIIVLHFPLIAGIVGCCAGSIAGITGQLMHNPPKDIKPKYVSLPPQGGDATIPVEARHENASDDSYDEPQATYPEMTMEQK